MQQYNDKQKGLESLIDDEAIESGGDSETEPSTESMQSFATHFPFICNGSSF